MNKIRATAGGFLADDSLRADVVVVAERVDAGGRRVEISLAWEFTEQDVALGHDAYSLSTEDGSTVYGGVTDWRADENRLVIHLDARAAQALGVDGGFDVDLSSLPNAREVIDGCRRVLAGESRPARKPDVGSVAESVVPRVKMAVDQLRFIELWVARVEGGSGLSIEDLGRGHYRIVVWDKTGVDIASRTVMPWGNAL
jgi:hypothetical protein